MGASSTTPIHEWITFNRLISKAIDAQKRGNAKSATEQQLTPYMALQRMAWELGGTSSRGEDAR